MDMLSVYPERRPEVKEILAGTQNLHADNKAITDRIQFLNRSLDQP